MIAATIGVGEHYERLAEEAAASVEWSTGLRAYVIRETPGETTPSLYKLRLLEMFSAESVLWFDADTRFIRKWDVSSLANRHEFFAVLDMPSGARDSDCRGYGIAPQRYFNAGIWIANSASHARAFAFANALCHSPHYSTRFQYEQTAMNVAMQRLKIPCVWLDPRYNYICDPKVPRPDDPVVIHRAGGKIGGIHQQTFEREIRDARGIQTQPVSG